MIFIQLLESKCDSCRTGDDEPTFPPGAMNTEGTNTLGINPELRVGKLCLLHMMVVVVRKGRRVNCSVGL